MNLTRHGLSIGIALVSTTALATPPSFTDARSFAMGGTGVAIAHPSTANTSNPAMLAADHHHRANDFGLVLPSVNARFADDEEVVDQIDDIQDNIDAFEEALDNLTPANEDEARAQAARLYDDLVELQGDTVRADAAAGISLAIPNETLAIGIFTNASATVSVRGIVSDADLAKLEDVIDGPPPPLSTVDADLDSSGRALAAAVLEAGVSLARSFDVGLENPVQFGVAPKYVQLRTYQYTQLIDDFDEDDFEADDYETTKSGFNMDVGAAYSFGQEQRWNAGIAVRNVIPMELDADYDPAKGEQKRTLELDPMVTVGIAHRGDFHVLTAEAELTEQKAFGYEDDTQWIAVGAEFDAFRAAQLRVGVRHNLASNDDNAGIEEDTQYTAGVGLSPFGAMLNISGLYSDTELGAAVELGIAF